MSSLPIVIKQIDNEQALQFLRDNKARQEVLFVRPCDIWYGAFVDNLLVGCGGYIFKPKYVMLSGLFVVGEYRKQGIAKKLNQRRLEDNAGKKIVGYARPINAHILMSHFGFEKKQEFQNGTVKVVRSETYA